MGKKCTMDCLNCNLPTCKYDKYAYESENTRRKVPENNNEPKKEVAPAIKKIVVSPKKGRPKKYAEGTYWENYSREHREELNAKERERYRNNREVKLAKAKKWREEHKGYYAEYRRRVKENDTTRKSKGVIGESEKLELGCESSVQS